VREEAARELCVALGMDKVFFGNSGTEAVETAIKLARRFQYEREAMRHDVWTYKGEFHGRTLGSLAASDGPSYHYSGFGPMPEGFYHFADIEEIPTDAAAVLVCPVFCNKDVIPFPDGWLKRLREYTAENDIVLIFDEIQTGMGRCGDFSFSRKHGIQPDVIALAKGMAMGYPMGAVLAKEEIADAFFPGTHFSTFGGNPLACQFLLGMINWIGENRADLIERSIQFHASLESLGWAANLRTEGMMAAFDIDVDRLDFADACLGAGLLIGAFSKGPGAVKLTPPLLISEAELLDAIEIMDNVYKELK
jgi:acetylornithine/succinyldiaminopimelate/putrescine aminotransferase